MSTWAEMIRQYLRFIGRRRAVVQVWMPGMKETRAGGCRSGRSPRRRRFPAATDSPARSALLSRSWRWRPLPLQSLASDQERPSRPESSILLTMDRVRSKDGTAIAFEEQGGGPALILVDGAMGTRSAGSKPELARLLARHFTVYSYDRRGRGDSGDTKPYAVEREIEDIGALIDEAGGSAFLYGHSSGGCLALEATIELGAKVTKLALYEVPYNDDPLARKAWGEYIENLTEALTSGRRGDAAGLFMALVGMPVTQIEEMRRAPFWGGMEAVAPTLAYDHTAIMGKEGSIPVERASRVNVPTLVWRKRCSVHAGDGDDAEQGDSRLHAERPRRPGPRRPPGGAGTGPRAVLLCLN